MSNYINQDPLDYKTTIFSYDNSNVSSKHNMVKI